MLSTPQPRIRIRALASAVAVGASFLLAACVPGAAPGSSAPIKIGLAGGLTGTDSFLGQAQQQGVTLAADEINANGGINGRKIQLISEDDQFNPSRAASIAQKLINQDKVDAIIAGTNTGTALVYAQAAEQAKLPLIVSFASDNRITQDKQWSWAVDAGVKEMMGVIADYTAEHSRKVAFAYDDNAFGQAARDFGLAAFQAKGIVPEPVVSLPNGSNDYSAQAASLKASGAAEVVAGDSGNNTAQLAKNMQQAGYKALLVGPSSVGFASMIDIGGPAVEHRVWFTDVIDDTNPKFQAFSQAYQERFNTRPQTGFEPLAYDSMQVLAAAVAKAGTDKDQLRVELNQIHYQGASGKSGSEISFPADSHRRPASGLTWRWVNDGHFENVPPAVLADPTRA